MADQSIPPYAVHLRPFQKDIAIGRLNKARTAFIGDQYEATEMVMFAVKEYVKLHGDTAFVYPDGTRLELYVTEDES